MPAETALDSHPALQALYRNRGIEVADVQAQYALMRTLVGALGEDSLSAFEERFLAKHLTMGGYLR